MVLRGRRKIVSDYVLEDMTDFNNLKKSISDAYRVHVSNKSEIDYLIAYKNGNQEILSKEKVVRPEINNKMVVNHAQMITRTIVGYFLGNPIQYVQTDGNKKDQLDTLNRIVAYEDKATVDKDIAELQSICGTAYRIIYTDGAFADDVPFEDKMLNPSTTFVVYENSIAERPLYGVTYLPLFNESSFVVGYKVFCYTAYGLHSFTTNDFSLNRIEDYTFSPYSIGGVPIVEYPNNIWRIGDWELVIDVMEALNTLESGRLDDIEQIVQSLIVFVNGDIDETTFNEMRQAGVISLKNTTNFPTKVDTISNPLDQSGIAEFASELKDFIYALIGIPDRNGKTAGGGDTGQAVELRDGWADLEIVARNKELTFKRAEKQALKIMLTILSNTQGTDLSLMDITIKFSRNKNNNLLVKTQAYMNLISTKTLDPSDCLTIVDLVSDVNDYVSRGKAFWGDTFAGKVPVIAPENNIGNEPETGNPKAEDNKFKK